MTLTRFWGEGEEKSDILSPGGSKWVEHNQPIPNNPSSKLFIYGKPVGRVKHITPNGKIDRFQLQTSKRQLMDDQANNDACVSFSSVQRVIAHLWCSLLKRQQVNLQDDFFEIGGHSLLVMHVLSPLCDIFHIELPTYTFYECPTIAEISQEIEFLGQENQIDVEKYAMSYLQTKGIICKELE